MSRGTLGFQGFPFEGAPGYPFSSIKQSVRFLVGSISTYLGDIKKRDTSLYMTIVIFCGLGYFLFFIHEVVSIINNYTYILRQNFIREY